MELSDLEPKQEEMFEMANLYPNTTGVGYVMWFGEVGGQHGPRLKVSNKPGRFAVDDNFVLSVSQTPEVVSPPNSVHIKQQELNRIVKWVQINFEDLMLLWKIHETGDEIPLPDGSILTVNTILTRLKKV